MTSTVFTGCMPALMTPCKADRTPDFDALVKKGKELIEAGMSAVVYCGSMGDWPLLSDAQRMEGVERLVTAGVPVVVGTSAVNTASAAVPWRHAVDRWDSGVSLLRFHALHACDARPGARHDGKEQTCVRRTPLVQEETGCTPKCSRHAVGTRVFLGGASTFFEVARPIRSRHVDSIARCNTNSD